MGKRSTRALPLVLGLNAAYHESAAAIIRGFEVVFAAEEERYTREKHAKVARVTNPDQLPWFAIRDCLRAANCTKLSDVDAVAYSLMPGKRLAMIGSDPYPISEAVGFGSEWGEHTFDHRVRSVRADHQRRQPRLPRLAQAFTLYLIISRTRPAPTMRLG